MTQAEAATLFGNVLTALNRALLESMSEGVCLATLDGTIVYTNSAEERMFGYGPGELVGQNFAVENAYEPAEYAQVILDVRTELQRSDFWRGEWRNRRKDGTEFSSTARVSTIDLDGQSLWLCVRDDSTQRQRVEDALRESQSRLQLAVDAGKMAVWEVDASTGEITGSPELYRLLGYPKGAAPTSEEIRSRYYPGEQERLQNEGRLAMERGEPLIENEFRYVWPNGEIRWLMLRAVVRMDAGGRPWRAIGVLMDVTDRKEGEIALLNYSERLETTVHKTTADRNRMWQLSTDMMLVSDFEGHIVSTNPAWTNLLGWFEEELAGKSFLDLVHPDDLAATLDEVGGLGEGRTTFRFQNRYRHKDGSFRHLSWSAVPADKLIHAVGRDVTAEITQAEALRQAQEALQQAQKMEAIGNLTGGVAHDFNNLLQVISGNLHMLRKDVAGREKAEQRVANALAGVSRGSKLANQLLAFGRRQPLAPKVVNVGKLVRGMDDMLRRSIGETIEIDTVVSGGLWNTLVDPSQIENAVLNLAINARDAMEDGGKLTVEVGNAFLDDEYVRKHAEVTAGQYVVLGVSDTGTGMPPEVLAKVFEPFYSTKPEGKGTGLGLSMVYGFVKQSGGHIKIYSEIGHGTTVRMYLPRELQDEDVLDAPDVGPAIGGTETILVAEDDEEVRDTVVEMLTELGYRVLKAKDASSALTVVESGIPIDVLFTDVVMPGTLKSPELARKAKERLPNLAVLFTSGYTENSIVHGGRLDAGVELLSKPYTREALARKIRHVLANQAQRSQATQPSQQKNSLNNFERSSDRPLSVLLVEDDAIIRMGTADMLGELGHIVIEAENAEKALSSLDENAIDVIITDVGLPGISGTDFAKQVRAKRPGLPIVFATGGVAGPEVIGGEKAFLLQKPYSQEEIAAILERISG